MHPDKVRASPANPNPHPHPHPHPHPDQVRVVTGQIGRDPKILIWSSRADAHGVLPQLCCIQGDHKRAIIGLSFSSTGAYIAAMGKDNNRCIALYR